MVGKGSQRLRGGLLLFALAFAPLAGCGTTLTLTHGPYDESPGSQEMRTGHLEGWTHFLSRLHEATEQGMG